MSPAARFKRALVPLLLELARVYGLTMSLNRDSADDVVKKNFRKIMLRAHPDKAGGSEATAKRLNAACMVSTIFSIQTVWMRNFVGRVPSEKSAVDPDCLY